MQEMSRREQNRRETWDALHRAAADLAFDGGPAAVTADAVAVRAGVSTRTFFNYFATKEEAILGFREPHLDEGALDEFRTGSSDRLERTVRLIVAAFASGSLPEHIGGRRVVLVQRHPELRSAFDAHVAAVERLVAPLLAEEFAAPLDEVTTHARREGITEPLARGPEGRAATAMLMLAATIVRFAYKTQLARMVDDREAALAEALATFRGLGIAS